MDDAPHTAEQKNPPDQPQFEGVVFSDGRCAIRWLTARGSTACWDSFDDMMAIHGHPEYGSELVWHGQAADEIGRLRERYRFQIDANRSLVEAIAKSQDRVARLQAMLHEYEHKECRDSVARTSAEMLQIWSRRRG